MNTNKNKNTKLKTKVKILLDNPIPIFFEEKFSQLKSDIEFKKNKENELFNILYNYPYILFIFKMFTN